MSGGGVVAIMQPTYLPYLGYLELIAQADAFVFLDDVQFERRSWQSRNRILGSSGEVMLTVPVRRHSRESLIAEIEIADDEPWRERHLRSIRHAYAGAPGFQSGFAWLETALSRPRGPGLAELTIGLIEALIREIGLDARRLRASELRMEGRRSEHLLGICRALNADVYLSTGGSRAYIETEGMFAAAGLPVRYHVHQPEPYPQAGRGPFMPYMSFVDALMNTGFDGLAALVTPQRP